jgi:hypothetical protein
MSSSRGSPGSVRECGPDYNPETAHRNPIRTISAVDLAGLRKGFDSGSRNDRMETFL